MCYGRGRKYLNNEERHDLYWSPSVTGHVARVEEKRNALRGAGEETCRKEATWKTKT